jgi:putative drug exporter of the RND superfamily
VSEPRRVARIWRGAAIVIYHFRLVIIAAWIVAAVLVVIHLPGFQTVQSAGLASIVPKHSVALATEEKANKEFGFPLLSRIMMVQRDPHGLTASTQIRAVTRAVSVDNGTFRQRYPDLLGAVPLLNTAGVVPGSRERSTTAVTYLWVSPTQSLGSQVAIAQGFARAEAGAPSDHLIGVTGAAPARLAQIDLIDSGIVWVELATVLFVALVIGLHFRSIGAPLATLATAGIAYVIATHVLAWAGQRAGLSVPGEIRPLVVVLLLGIITDYSIFFLSGARNQLRGAGRRRDATVESTSAFLPIILAAGLIVAAAVLSLVVARLDFFRALGPGLAITVLIGLAISTTLVPALIGTFGRWLFWPRIPRGEGPTHPKDDESGPRLGWRSGLIAAITKRPVAAICSAVIVGLLVWAALPLLHVGLGISLIRELPSDQEAARAGAAATHGFVPGVTAPSELVVTEAGIGNRADVLGRLNDLLSKQPGVGAVIGPGTVPTQVPAGLAGPGVTPPQLPAGIFVSKDGASARYIVLLANDPLGSTGIATLGRLQAHMPGLLRTAGAPGATAAFAGDTALARETVQETVGDLWRIGLTALAVSLLLLVIYLRALVAPLYLLAASVLVVAATLGLTTLVFQDVLGHDGLTYYMPFAAAVLLLALGSDYNVFLVGRIWEESRVRPTIGAVRYAAPRASRAITVAGLALAGSFAVLALVRILPFLEFAFAMVVGLILDTFVVRSILVPSLVALFGGASFWPRREPSPPQKEMPASAAAPTRPAAPTGVRRSLGPR